MVVKHVKFFSATSGNASIFSEGLKCQNSYKRAKSSLTGAKCGFSEPLKRSFKVKKTHLDESGNVYITQHEWAGV